MNLLIKLTTLAIASLLFCNTIHAQKFLTKTGHAYFMSHTDAIDIDGNNHQVAGIADTETGELVVIVLIKAFEFTLATADKHFNETYMESDEFPKAIFKGHVPSLKTIDLSKDGEYPATAEGNLTIHGQTKTIKEDGKLIVKNGTIGIECKFNASIDDYGIKVPKSVEDRVAKLINIEVYMTLTPK